MDRDAVSLRMSSVDYVELRIARFVM